VTVDTQARDGRAVQPRALIVTVYGAYVRDLGGWLSVAHLIDLMAELGVDDAAVRSSIWRLKRRGIVHAERRDGVAGYALSGSAQDILRAGDQRIFRQPRARLADGWVVAVFSIPESERRRRHLLRSQLSRLGFGTTGTGVWIAPAHLATEAADALRRLELTQYVELFRADYLGFGELTESVAGWWDLVGLEKLYDEFLGAHEPVRAKWARRRGPDDTRRAAEAFADHVRTLNAWRRMPYLDPGLPAELLPRDWSGTRAAEVFAELHDRLAGAAMRHVRAVTAER
jgi:phenylacetic acid degradation operon negative regulatory protein